MVASQNNIFVYANSVEEIEEGWTLHGVTYGNCGNIPHWHEEPLDLHENDVDIWFRIRHGGKHATSSSL